MEAQGVSRRDFVRAGGLGALSLLGAGSLSGARGASARRPPNIIVIFCDDLGYGDLSIFGHPTIRTPHLDRMAQEGQKWTSFYAAASLCTPSRAALLTGRLPIRNGMCSDVRGVLFPDSAGGLPQSEITIARALKGRGYATACIGKWHLGHLPPHLPTSHGFDSYFGIPYSNDMDRVPQEEAWDPDSPIFRHPRSASFNVPLMRNEKIVERPADQTTITRRYTEEATRFIRANRDRPFFLYLAHSMPHVPLFASKDFQGRSVRGLYGDVVEEIDSGVGQILATLQEERVAENTLVVFTSDNGPWLVFKDHGGSAGSLRDGKGTTFEGGMREPTVFWWPGRIAPGIVTDLGSTLDLFTTACALAGAPPPRDRVLDGFDLSPALFGTGESPRHRMFFYRGTTLYAVRKSAFKAHFLTQRAFRADARLTRHDPPLLFNLDNDPGETHDVAARHPDVVADLRREAERHRATVTPVEDQLAKVIE
jgi:arylsulfatase A